MAKKQIESPAYEAVVLGEESKNDTRAWRIVSAQRWAEIPQANQKSGLAKAALSNRSA